MAYDGQYTRYQTERSLLRRMVRKGYLRSARRQLKGPVLDFGCGVGELLAMLPAGSKGLEYNAATVAHCRNRGLDVDWYDGFADDWSLSVLPAGRRFQSMVVSHVLEHFAEPVGILRKLVKAVDRLGVDRVLVIVPGKAGFRIDETHRTLVDAEMLRHESLVDDSAYRLRSLRYFPGDVRVIGDLFPHHELQALYVRKG